jgi:hypothetical protein
MIALSAHDLQSVIFAARLNERHRIHNVPKEGRPKRLVWETNRSPSQKTYKWSKNEIGDEQGKHDNEKNGTAAQGPNPQTLIRADHPCPSRNHNPVITNTLSRPSKFDVPARQTWVTLIENIKTKPGKSSSVRHFHAAINDLKSEPILCVRQ